MQPSTVAELSNPITPLRAPSFDSLLSRFHLLGKYPDLIHFIQHGFPIGPMPSVSETIIQQNHITKPNEIAIVRQDIMKEVALGRMVGPLNVHKAQSLLGGNFRTSPMGLVPKSGSLDLFRVIRNLSYKGSAPSSVNDYVPEDRPTRFVGFDEFAHQVRISTSVH